MESKAVFFVDLPFNFCFPLAQVACLYQADFEGPKKGKDGRRIDNIFVSNKFIHQDLHRTSRISEGWTVASWMLPFRCWKTSGICLKPIPETIAATFEGTKWKERGKSNSFRAVNCQWRTRKLVKISYIHIYTYIYIYIYVYIYVNIHIIVASWSLTSDDQICLQVGKPS